MSVIKRLRIRNYRGIAELDVSVPGTGVQIRGRNGGGKTSALNAIAAALAAQDVGPDAIRRGADKAEILVDLDELSVKRSIFKNKKSELAVSTSVNGMKAVVTSPQTYLTELLGTSPLDPILLITEKDKKKRRARILEILPVKVTLAQLKKWAPDLPDDTDVSGHGLEVVERVRGVYYDARKFANADVKKQKAEADRLATIAEAADKGWSGVTLSIVDADASLRQAEDGLRALESRAEEAAKSEERTAKTRARVVALRAEAEKASAAVVAFPPEEDDRLWKAWQDAEKLVHDLKCQLAVAMDRAGILHGELNAHHAVRAANQATERQALELASQATELEAALAEAAVAPVEPSALAEANERVRLAQKAKVDAEGAEAAVQAKAVADVANATLESLEDKAEQLDLVVAALTNLAPGELLAESDGIPGLTLDGDEVLLDDVRLDKLSGREQILFAVEVAKRANAKSKILVVDGLEKIDPEQSEAFIEAATSGGFQLFATKVDRGDVVIESFSSDPPHVNGEASLQA